MSLSINTAAFPPNFKGVRLPSGARLAENLKKSLTFTNPEEKILFWSGFMYVPAAVLTPIMTNWQLRQQHTPDYERSLLVRSETIRQIIGALAHFAGFFGGMALFGLGKKPGKPRTMQRLLGSIVGATVSYAFVRPLILNTYMAKWVKQNQPGNQRPLNIAHGGTPPLISRPLPSQPLQHLRTNPQPLQQLAQPVASLFATRQQWLA